MVSDMKDLVWRIQLRLAMIVAGDEVSIAGDGRNRKGGDGGEKDGENAGKNGREAHDGLNKGKGRRK